VTYTTLHFSRFPGFATPPGPSRVQAWLHTALRSLGSCKVLIGNEPQPIESPAVAAAHSGWRPLASDGARFEDRSDG
jgi:hypothetical protein